MLKLFLFDNLVCSNQWRRSEKSRVDSVNFSSTSSRSDLIRYDVLANPTVKIELYFDYTWKNADMFSISLFNILNE